jgi:hypothetical protein
MTKFTIDLENKKILFHEPFTKEELEEVLSLLNIPEKDTWKIDLSDNYLSDKESTDIWQHPTLNWYGDPNNTDPYQPPYIVSGSGTINLTGNSTIYSTTTTDGITLNNSTDTYTLSNLQGIYN